ncbi:hypothetical protein HK098_007201, partial [Nowakowskiella sp. JEL0407]
MTDNPQSTLQTLASLTLVSCANVYSFVNNGIKSPRPNYGVFLSMLVWIRILRKCVMLQNWARLNQNSLVNGGEMGLDYAEFIKKLELGCLSEPPTNTTLQLSRSFSIQTLVPLCRNLQSLQIIGGISTSSQLRFDLSEDLITSLFASDFPALRELSLLYLPIPDQAVLRGLKQRNGRNFNWRTLSISCIGSRSPENKDIDSLIQYLEMLELQPHPIPPESSRKRISPEVLYHILSSTTQLTSLYITIKDQPKRIFNVVSETVGNSLTDFGFSTQWSGVIDPNLFAKFLESMRNLESLSISWSSFIQSHRPRILDSISKALKKSRNDGIDSPAKSLSAIAIHVANDMELGIVFDGFLDLGVNLTRLRIPGSVLQRMELLLVAYSCPNLLVIEIPDFGSLSYGFRVEQDGVGEVEGVNVAPVFREPTQPMLSLWIDVLEALPKLRVLNVCGVPMPMDSVLTYVALMRTNFEESSGGNVFETFHFTTSLRSATINPTSVCLSNEDLASTALSSSGSKEWIWDYVTTIERVYETRTTRKRIPVRGLNEIHCDVEFQFVDMCRFARMMKDQAPGYVDSFMDLYRAMRNDMIESKKKIMELMAEAKALVSSISA